jgi:type 1 glutamine amidotransferase
LLWAREYGRSRIVYDALGHDTRSYDSQAHRELIRRAALWALGS